MVHLGFRVPGHVFDFNLVIVRGTLLYVERARESERGKGLKTGHGPRTRGEEEEMWRGDYRCVGSRAGRRHFLASPAGQTPSHACLLSSLRTSDELPLTMAQLEATTMSTTMPTTQDNENILSHTLFDAGQTIAEKSDETASVKTTRAQLRVEWIQFMFVDCLKSTLSSTYKQSDPYV